MDKLWAENAWLNYLEWHDSDIRVWTKINELIKEIERTPFKGTGRPHPLKHDLRSLWSRGLTQEHTKIYRVEGKVLRILNCRGHYE